MPFHATFWLLYFIRWILLPFALTTLFHHPCFTVLWLFYQKRKSNIVWLFLLCIVTSHILLLMTNRFCSVSSSCCFPGCQKPPLRYYPASSSLPSSSALSRENFDICDLISIPTLLPHILSSSPSDLLTRQLYLQCLTFKILSSNILTEQTLSFIIIYSAAEMLLKDGVDTKRCA